MPSQAVVYCCECRKPIVSREGFACFKEPGKESYRFFHYRAHARTAGKDF